MSSSHAKVNFNFKFKTLVLLRFDDWVLFLLSDKFDGTGPRNIKRGFVRNSTIFDPQQFTSPQELHRTYSMLDGVTEKEAKDILRDAIFFTTAPKSHFNTLRNRLEVWKEYLRHADNGSLYLWCTDLLLHTVTPFGSTRAIFDRFTDSYLHGHTKAWNILVYASETSAESEPGAEFLSIEQTKARLEIVKTIETDDDWARAIATCKYQIESVLLKTDRKLSQYKEPRSSFFVEQVMNALFFLELPNQLIKALDPTLVGSFSERLLKFLFFVLFGILNWISIVIQLSFAPLIFFVAYFIPNCY